MPNDMPSDVFGNDFGAVADRNSVTATWTIKDGGAAATGIQGILSEVKHAQKDVDAGFIPELPTEFHVQASEFTAAIPTNGDTFTIGSTVYQILSHTTEPSGVVII